MKKADFRLPYHCRFIPSEGQTGYQLSNGDNHEN
jgi:hypothetical protein